MFGELQKGDRVKFEHYASGSVIESVVVDYSPFKAWVDIAGDVTLYEADGWVRVDGDD